MFGNHILRLQWHSKTLNENFEYSYPLNVRSWVEQGERELTVVTEGQIKRFHPISDKIWDIFLFWVMVIPVLLHVYLAGILLRTQMSLPIDFLHVILFIVILKIDIVVLKIDIVVLKIDIVVLKKEFWIKIKRKSFHPLAHKFYCYFVSANERIDEPWHVIFKNKVFWQV